MGRECHILSKSRDYFAEVRNAALELERTQLQLEALNVHKKDRPGDPYAPHVASSRDDVNGTSRLIAGLDRAKLLHDREKRCQQKLQAASWVLYGQDGEGGVAQALSNLDADVVWHRCARAYTWRGVEAATMCSASVCRQRYEAVMNYLDDGGLIDDIGYITAG